MADSILDAVGENNMHPDAKDTVIAILHRWSVPPTSKRYMYAQWARRAGVPLLPADLDRVAPCPAR